MRRRSFLTFTSAVPLLAGATACSRGGGGSGAAASEAELRFTWWGNADRQRATTEVIDLFNAAHPDMAVSGEPSDDAYWDRLATTTAANDAPDIITLGGAYVAEYAGRGALLDLAEVSEQLPLDGVDEAIVPNGQIDGVQYAMTTGVNALSVMVNADVLAAAGVEVPEETWTWDEYLQLARTITENSPDGTYGTDGGLTHDSVDAFARQRGEALYTPDGELGLTVATMTDLLTLSLEAIQSGAAPSATVIGELSSVPLEQGLMGTGQAGMMLGWSNLLTAMAAASGADLRLLTLPTDTPEQSGLWLQSSQFYGIYARSAAPEAAATFVNFVLTDPEATAIVGVDRGIPTYAEVRDAIAPGLAAPDQAQSDYVDRLRQMDLAPLTIGPTGSTAVQDITQRALTDVGFGNLTPAEAAERWFAESEAAIA